MKKFLLTALIISLPLLPGCGCSKNDAHQEHHDEEGVVHLKEESQKMIGLEMASVNKGFLLSGIEVSGEIAQETENVQHVAPPTAGTLQSMKVEIGEVVEEGSLICLIKTAEGTEVEIKSPGHGIVMAHYLKEGDSVDTVSSIVTIANPDILRASFNVYEKDLGALKVGQKVSVKTVAYSDKEFEGNLVFISPQVDSQTRTIKVRVNIQNEDHLLKFGMFVTGKILTPLEGETLSVPAQAIQEIESQTVVFAPKENEAEEFLMTPVKVGRKLEEQVEVLQGLQEGQKIVSKGSFYLKSELLKGELEEGHAH